MSPALTAEIAARRFLSTKRFIRPGAECDLLQGASSSKTIAGTKLWCFGSGPIVFFVHGWDGRGSQFSSFVGPLVSRGFQVVLWDGPSHGDSDGSTTNVGEFVRKLLLIQKEFGPFTATIGHSFGGAVVLLAVANGLNTKSIVTIASPYSLDEVIQRFSSFFELSNSTHLRLRRSIERRAKIKIEETKIDDLVSKIEARGLIVHDENDKEIPFADADRIHRAWPSAGLLKTRRLGHRRILADGELVTRVIDFVLDQLNGRQIGQSDSHD